MTPICLVTGFLGSGKTTLLRRLAAVHRERRLTFLVNEFSTLDVDGPILGEAIDGSAETRVVSIAGGSIFCKCLVAAFIKKLNAVLDRPGLEGVVVEASGMADPSVAARMLGETGLSDRARLAHVIAVVDPITLPKLLHTLPNITRQIAAANTVLINKSDLVDSGALAEAVEHVVTINPDARLLTATHAEVDPPLFDTDDLLDVAGELAECRDPNYVSWELELIGKNTRGTVDEFVRVLGDDLYRLKGWIDGITGPMAVDVVNGRVTWRPAPTPHPPSLALIARGGAANRVESLIRERLRNARPAKAPDVVEV